MTDTADYRRQWRERGELFDCPNPPHSFSFGRLVGQWCWASDCWSSILSDGYLVNYGLCLCTINTLDGQRAYKLVIWRLSVIVGLAARGEQHA